MTTAERFIADRIRPRAEQIRALLRQMEDDVADWYGGPNAEIPNDAATECGIDKSLTGADVHNLVVRETELIALLNGAGKMAVVHKACVRPLGVTLHR